MAEAERTVRQNPRQRILGARRSRAIRGRKAEDAKRAESVLRNLTPSSMRCSRLLKIKTFIDSVEFNQHL